MSLLQDDPRLFFSAAAKAQAAVDWLLDAAPIDAAPIDDGGAVRPGDAGDAP